MKPADLQRLFGCADLYGVLGVPRTASDGDIKRAFRQASLRYHPDKAQGELAEHANERFHALTQVYEALSKAELRRVYDETGVLPDDDPLSSDAARDWYEYFQQLFAHVTPRDIDDFAREYRESEEERRDVLRVYEQHEGDMDAVIDGVMLATPDDTERFKRVIDAAIADGSVQRFAAYDADGEAQQRARRRRYDRERRKAEKASAGSAGASASAASSSSSSAAGDVSSLAALISARQAQRNVDMSALLARYEQQPARSSKKRGK